MKHWYNIQDIPEPNQIVKIKCHVWDSGKMTEEINVVEHIKDGQFDFRDDRTVVIREWGRI